MKINVISDSTYTVQGHGVHTAFEAQVDGLRTRGDVQVSVNSWSRGYDITHIHTFGPLGLYHALFGSGKKVISAHVIPASLVGSIRGAKFWLPLMNLYLKLFYSCAHLICAVSQGVIDSLRNDLRVQCEAIVLYNGINMSEYSFTPEDRQIARSNLDIHDNAFVVVGNGQIQPRKRFDTFVAVADRLREMNFIWVGGAPFGRLSDDYSHLQRMVEESPSNVFVTGVIDHSQVKQYLVSADVFFMPSAQENHPMAVLEAAGAGLPIVLRDIHEYDDSFGQNVLRGDDGSFAEILLGLKNDAQYYAAAQQGSQRIAQRFDNSQIIEELMGYYQQLVPNR